MLANDLAPWPGDTPFEFQLKWRMAEGATVNVGAVTMGVHNGTHADAIFHFDPSGGTIESIPLETYVGPATVIDVAHLFALGDAAELRQVAVSDLERGLAAMSVTPRFLLKTNVWRDSWKFPDRIPVIAPDVPRWLQARGVKLLGLDLPSVDTIDSKTLPNHHALAAAGVMIVESLDLSAVDAGNYNFAALPLKIAAGDAAPVRAILWRE
jgi:arylformamidase